MLASHRYIRREGVKKREKGEIFFFFCVKVGTTLVTDRDPLTYVSELF